MVNERLSPQLVMHLENFDKLPMMDLPEKYSTRSAKEGDEQAWVDIINDSFGYSANRSFDSLKREACFSYDRVFFVLYNGIPVGTATSWYRQEWPDDTGYLHMVGVKQDHSGKHLGAYVSLEALAHMKARGFKSCVLQTDDFRIPAIKTYLRLGFQPKFTHENHLERWDHIKEKIKI
ncbi:MAG TPA: hypothetical protein DDZ89_02755 [Clostridiales bacterium]|nr:hypothetical protein [Clostridiales bacterium]